MPLYINNCALTDTAFILVTLLILANEKFRKKNRNHTVCMVSSTYSIIPPLPDNNAVRLIFYNELIVIPKDKKVTCKYLGTLVSSEGHWYSFLFISNANLTQGCINDMHNKASELGANVVYINDNIDFGTSVTLLGQAYICT